MSQKPFLRKREKPDRVKLRDHLSIKTVVHILALSFANLHQ